MLLLIVLIRLALLSNIFSTLKKNLNSVGVEAPKPVWLAASNSKSCICVHNMDLYLSFKNQPNKIEVVKGTMEITKSGFDILKRLRKFPKVKLLK